MNTGVYGLIAKTSFALRESIKDQGPNPKWPQPITEIQTSLANAHDGETTIQVMETFIQQYGR